MRRQPAVDAAPASSGTGRPYRLGLASSDKKSFARTLTSVENAKGGTMLAESIFRTSMRVTLETVCGDTFGKLSLLHSSPTLFFYSKRKTNAHKPFLLDPTVHRHYISVNWKMPPSMNPRVAACFPVCLLSYALTPASRGPRELPRVLSARFVGDLQHLVLQEVVYDFQIGLRVC